MAIQLNLSGRVRPISHHSGEKRAEEYGTRLKACATHINEHHDVYNLCRELPARLNELSGLEGDRLAH